MKIDLYIDFDGVILNTIDVASDIYFGDREHVGYPPRSFYEDIDWNELLDKCQEINNSIIYLDKLIKSDLYHVAILTHVVCDDERKAKINFLKNKFPDLKVITVFKDYNKCDVVECKNSILVDDYLENLVLWQSKGGIAIKFSDKNKKYDFISISNLGSLIDIFPKLRALVKEKTC